VNAAATTRWHLAYALAALLAIARVAACSESHHVARSPSNEAPRLQTGASALVPVGGATRDPCDVPDGITFHGKRRYVHGVNYAWYSFGADFGGIAKWKQPSISQQPAIIDRDFAAMAAAGVSVVRMWIFPDLRSDGIAIRAADGSYHLTPQVLQDLAATLALARQHNLYLLFVFTSFDAFKQPMNRSGISIPSLAPVIRDANSQASFIANVFIPLLSLSIASANANRVFGWELMNEPEWAVQEAESPGMCGTKPEQVDCVTRAEMHGFLSAMAEALHTRTAPLPEAMRPLLTIGSVRRSAQLFWSDIPQDFYQFHFYQHDYAHSNLARPQWGKPVVIGELPSWGVTNEAGKPSMDVLAMLNEIEHEGYAGAFPWGFTKLNSNFNWPKLAASLKLVSDRDGCKGRF
jgi:hypothetical protein